MNNATLISTLSLLFFSFCSSEMTDRETIAYAKEISEWAEECRKEHDEKMEEIDKYYDALDLILTARYKAIEDTPIEEYHEHN